MPSRASAKSPVQAAQPPAGRAEWLAGVLRERLSSGVYRPGQWLRENALRLEFGFSNGPVREALQLLVAEGLLERVPYCGIRVAALSDREIVELFQLRLGLLELAAELAARRGDRTTLARAPQVLAEIRRNVSADRRPAPGHLTGWVIAAAGNRELARSWERLAAKARIYVYESTRRAADPDGMTRHAERLVAAIVEGQPAEARNAVRALSEHQMKDLGLELNMS